MEEYCLECGYPYPEGHHVVYRSHAKYMEHVPINIIPLCSYHHKDSHKSPHKSEEKDREYKRNLQAKYKNLFCKDYYTLTEIKEKLQVSERIARGIVKTLRITKEGYKSSELIFHLMGDENYDTGD